MNGTEHYREAERLIAAVTLSGPHMEPVIDADEPQTIALAQVHATLALAAAVGGIDPAPDVSGRWAPDERRWREIVAPEQANRGHNLDEVGS